MIPVNTKEIGKEAKDALAFRFYQAVKASTEDPAVKAQILRRMEKEDKPDDTPAIKGQRGVRGAPAQNGSTPEKAKA